MRQPIPLFTLLLAIFMFMLGIGAIPAIIGIRLNSAGYSGPVIGLLGTGYFAGLTLGSVRAFRLISRVGHIRAFAAYVSVVSASTLAYSIAQNVPVWLALRFVNGFCVAGVFVCLESWLNDQTKAENRGMSLGLYMVALYGGQAVSQLLLGVEPVNPVLPFVIASLILSITVLPVALTYMTAPVNSEQRTFRLAELYAISPLGLVGVVTSGLMLGAFYTMGPVHAQRIGMPNMQIATLLGTVIAGGMILQWPLGWLSDRFDRRMIIVVSLAATAAICTLMAVFGRFPLLSVSAMLFGAFAFALYPLCVAHTNDHLTGADRVGASGGLVLAYSVGAAIGPLIGAASMKLLGPGGLYWFIAACAAVAFLFGIWRQIISAPVPVDDQQRFQVLPRTTPMIASLDPELPAGEAGE